MKKGLGLLFFLGVYNSYCDASSNYIYSTPSDFLGLVKEVEQQQDVIFGEGTIDQGTLKGDGEYISSDGEHYLLGKPYDCFASKMVAKLMKGNSQQCGSNQFQLVLKEQKIFFLPDKTLYQILSKAKPEVTRVNTQQAPVEYLPESTSDNISGGLSYDANFSRNARGILNGSLNIPLVMAYKEYSLDAKLNARSSEATNTAEVKRLVVNHTYQGRRQSFGLLPKYDSQTYRSSLDVAKLGDSLGYTYSTTDDTNLRKNQTSSQELSVYSPMPATVEVYRENELIYVGKLAAGSNAISTKQFPRGVYPVTIKRIVNGSESLPLLEEVIDNVGKSSSFGIQVGFMSRREQQANGLLKKDYDSPFMSARYAGISMYGAQFSAAMLAKSDGLFIQPELNYSFSNGGGLRVSLESQINSAVYGVDTALTLNSDALFSGSSFSLRHRINNGDDSYWTNSSATFSVSPTSFWSDSLNASFNFRQSQYHVHAGSENNRITRELTLSSNKSFQYKGVQISTNTSLATSNYEALSGSIMLTFSKLEQDGLNYRASYSVAKDSGASNVQLGVNHSTQVNGYDVITDVSANGSDQNYRLGATVNAVSDTFSANAGAFYNTHDGSSDQFLRFNGHAGFSGDKLALTGIKATSGLVVNVDAKQSHRIYASVQGLGAVKLHPGKNVISIKPFTKGVVSFNSENSVLSRDTFDYVMYKGNFEYVTLKSQETITIAGKVRTKSHITRVVNHASSTAIASGGSDKYEYFQMKVLKENPEIKLVNNSGQVVCARNISKKIVRTKDYAYIGDVTCD